MDMPIDYRAGYGKARAIDPVLASSYVAHTLIGDPQADAFVEELFTLGRAGMGNVLKAAIEQDTAALRNRPVVVREFFKGIEDPPDWVDFDAFGPGIRMFHRNSRLILGAFAAGTLVEGLSTNIAKSFFITGRLRDQGVRRLRQNNRHMVEIFMPGGLERHGDGWKLSVRIRIVHAQVRRMLKESDDWDAEAWGVPISAAHVGYAICAFSTRLLHHMKRLGADFNDEERASFMEVWRYTGHLMGIPETILYRNEEEALKLHRIGRICEPPPDMESIAMCNSLINSAPLVAGIERLIARRNLATYVYKISRALIGNDLADQLKFPRSLTLGALPLFRLERRYKRWLERLLPGYAGANRFSGFAALLEVSAFDEEGIPYELPSHVYAEKAAKW